MADLWLPDVERIVGQSAGAMSGAGGRKLLLHSTEGTTIDGALAAYRARNVWPTLTVDCRRRRPVEHLPLNVAARALKNLPGGVETNRGGRVLVQIELIGFAGTPYTIGTPADLDWFGTEIVAPICQLTGIPLTTSVPWVPYPASYGVGQGQRLTGQAWLDYSGLIGHQHAPENDHGDPGAIDVTRILAAARTLLEDDMTPDECRTVVREEIDRARLAYGDVLVAADPKGEWWQTDGKTRRRVSGRAHAQRLLDSRLIRAAANPVEPYVWPAEDIDRIPVYPEPAPPVELAGP